MNTSDRVMKLLSVTGQLNNLIQRENEMLAAQKSDGLKDLIEEKQSLGAVYEQHVRVLREEETMKEVDPSLRRRLAEALDTFSGLLEENKSRIEANIEASRRMFEIIAEAAKESQLGAGVYGNSGTIGGNPKRGYAPPLSVGMSQEL